MKLDITVIAVTSNKTKMYDHMNTSVHAYLPLLLSLRNQDSPETKLSDKHLH